MLRARTGEAAEVMRSAWLYWPPECRAGRQPCSAEARQPKVTEVDSLVTYTSLLGTGLLTRETRHAMPQLGIMAGKACPEAERPPAHLQGIGGNMAGHAFMLGKH